MAAVIENTADDYRRDLERRGITLELAVPADLPPVRGEPGILAQMLGSLIANAAEAMTSGGKLTLSLERQGTDMLVDVEDSGPGFKSDAQSKVFTPFYTTKQKGLGLGLPLVKRVIERFGGRVVLGRSRAEGAHVRLVLPIYSGASE
jgi:signal transduction histidine kinase